MRSHHRKIAMERISQALVAAVHKDRPHKRVRPGGTPTEETDADPAGGKLRLQTHQLAACVVSHEIAHYVDGGIRTVKEGNVEVYVDDCGAVGEDPTLDERASACGILGKAHDRGALRRSEPVWPVAEVYLTVRSRLDAHRVGIEHGVLSVEVRAVIAVVGLRRNRQPDEARRAPAEPRS